MACKGLFVVLSGLSSHNHITIAQFNPAPTLAFARLICMIDRVALAKRRFGPGPTDPTSHLEVVSVKAICRSPDSMSISPSVRLLRRQRICQVLAELSRLA